MARVQRAGRKLQPTPARTTQNLLDIPFRVLRVRLLGIGAQSPWALKVSQAFMLPLL